MIHKTSVNLWHKFIFPILRYFRRKRGKFIEDQFPDIAAYRICDLGGSHHYWEEIGLNIQKKNITIFNISNSEVENNESETVDQIEFRIFDGKRIPVDDGYFDLVVCNSVIEHVPYAARGGLAKEMCRVARHVYCQTPCYWFPIEPHFVCPFIHWLPRPLGRLFVFITPWRLLSKATSEQAMNYFDEISLLTEGELRALFPNARIHKETFAGFTKSYEVLSSQST